MTNDSDKVVDIKAKKRAQVAAALAEARHLNPARIWRTYKCGSVTINGEQIEPGEWEPGVDGWLPDYCPVTPLGRDGDTYYFLNVGGGISTLTADKCGKGRVNSLFAGATGFLVHTWPRFDKQGQHVPDNYANESASTTLFNAAHEQGAFNPTDKVRGRGAWPALNGMMVLHLGETIHSGDELLPPGVYDGHVYSWRPRLPEPSREQDDPPCGTQIMEDLMSWNWRRGETDARCFLGWIGAAMIGGWLSWRPNVFLTGDRAVGKSELQKYAKRLCGDFLIEAHDATGAGIHQRLGQDSVAVGIDEMEQEAGSRKTDAIIQLARRASSGGRILRGGSDHKGHEFIIQSCFLFSSIAPPSMRSQDISRLTILEMDRLTAKGASPAENATRLGIFGRQYLRRLLHWTNTAGEDEPTRFHDLLVLIKGHLEGMGHKDDRPQKQFGTLLACAWIACYDRMPELEVTDADGRHELDRWCEGLNPDAMLETSGQLPSWHMCLNHLLHVTAEPLKNDGITSVGGIIAARRNALTQRDDGHSLNVEDANKKLQKLGLAFVTPTDPHTKKPLPQSWDNLMLFVPKAHPEVAKLFRDTDWAAIGGAEGTWTFLLRQMDRDLFETNRKRIEPGGSQLWGSCLKLKPLFERYLDTEDEE